ncbi:MAG: GAK system ATP-grasp enzyme [Pseudomonadales bacterium]|nr:GAK system ATP-grasp enzyme [Pseudomonadales bacterium]
MANPVGHQSCPQIGVVGNRGSWSTESLGQQLHKKGAGGAIVEFNQLSFDLTEQRFIHPDLKLETLDGLVVKKLGPVYSAQLINDLSVLAQLENQGLHIFSAVPKLQRIISRLDCTIALRANDIPMPPTFISRNPEQACYWIKANGPAILKPLYSTKARGMLVLDDASKAEQMLAQYIQGPEQTLYLQKKLDIGTTDYALAFLGGKFLAAYGRAGDGSSWHTTTVTGRKYISYEPPQAIIELASRAQACFELDFCCVDVAISQELGPVVFEVSAFGGFKGLKQGAGIDVAELFADYVIAQFLRQP